MSNIFQIPAVLETLDNEMAAGLEPDPALVAWIVQEGPKAVESWVDCIEKAESEAELLANRIKELQGRKQAREQTVARMKDVLSDLLNKSFSGKVKTAEVTVWTQESKSYDFSEPTQPKYLIIPPPRVDKKALIADLKAGTLPPEIIVTENTKTTLRISR